MIQPNFEIVDGSPGLTIAEIGHVLVPGRGRNDQANGLTKKSAARVRGGVDFFITQQLEAKGGVIVASGYKTPGDKAGEPWSPPDTNEQFQGIPEAYLMREVMVQRGIGRAATRVEPRSIDTVTNLARSETEGHFPDERPVAIVSHQSHLERILPLIAPRTLRRDFLGIVVPDDEADHDKDSLAARLVSRAVLLGIGPDTPDIVAKTERRANAIWKAVLTLERIAGASTQYPPD